MVPRRVTVQLSFPRVPARHRLWAGGALAAASLVTAILALLPGWELFLLARPSTCLLKLFTGLPCLACRGTRAAIALARGDLGAALRFNPLATVFVIVVAAWLALLSLGGRSVRVRPTRPECIILWTLLGLALAANWAYVIAKGG